MTAPYGFGLSQEDERTDAAALQLTPGDRVLCIASAGETPLSLLALGAGEVVAVDTCPAQLHLVALKLAAVRALAPAKALRFLGFLDAPRRARLREYDLLAPLLPRDAERFWSTRRGVIAAGVIGSGRYERYVRLVRFLARPLLPRRRLEGLFRAADLDAQREYFDREVARPALRRVFRLAFDPRAFARRGVDARSLAQRRSATHLGDEYFQRFRGACTNDAARENPFLQMALLGRILEPSAAPVCFTERGAAVVREGHERLELRCGDVAEMLRREPAGRFDKVHLSNLADWLDPDAFAALLRDVARVVRPGRAVWRELHVRRGVPTELLPAMRADRAMGEALAARDRFPFYRIVPVSIDGERA